MTHAYRRVLRTSAAVAGVIALTLVAVVPSAADTPEATELLGDPRQILIENVHAADKVLEIGNDAAQTTGPDGAWVAAAAIFALGDAPDELAAQTVTAYPVTAAENTFVLADADGDVLVRRDNADAEWRYLALSDLPLADAAANAYAQWTFADAGDGRVNILNVAPGANGQSAALDMYDWKTEDGSQIQTWDLGPNTVQQWIVHEIAASLAPVAARVEPGIAPQLPTTVIARYDWGLDHPLDVAWAMPAAEVWQSEGTIVVEGSGTGFFGEEVEVRAEVLVGAVGDAVDAAVSAHAGITVTELRMRAPRTVERAVSGSEITVTAPVTWDWSTVSDADLALPGEVIVPAVDGTGFAANLVVSVIATAQVNILREGGVNWTYTHKDGTAFALTDGVRDRSGFADWRSGGAANRVDPNTVSFYLDRPRQVTGAGVWDLNGTSNVGEVTVQYRDLIGGWVDLPVREHEWPYENTTAALEMTVESEPVLATGIRVVVGNKSDDTWMSLSEVEVYGPALAG
ncbi:Ig-like domain-containing protein [Microbacterium sp. NPDC077184]|uniref:Ig-like domain-containing protein n=1 Tax=Microbacterium sp. NPDC077184 TaxID=3154764 RepID=UPI003425B59B